MKLHHVFDTPKKIVVVMPAFNAASTLKATMDHVPPDLVDEFILVDDASKDNTFEQARTLGITVLRHPENRGYGGNQKSCYRLAIASKADIVVMLHPDNQYNPEIIPNLILPILMDQADVVLASRFICDPLKGGPVAGGMPFLKFFANRCLTFVQNALMGTYFSEFHTGYRAFNSNALSEIQLDLLSNDFAFDNEILAVLAYQKKRFAQVAVETRYFKEASTIHFLPGVRYAACCLLIGFHYFLDRIGIRQWNWLHRVAKKPG